jgi:hypothetical protein
MSSFIGEDYAAAEASRDLDAERILLAGPRTEARSADPAEPDDLPMCAHLLKVRESLVGKTGAATRRLHGTP